MLGQRGLAWCAGARARCLSLCSAGISVADRTLWLCFVCIVSLLISGAPAAKAAAGYEPTRLMRWPRRDPAGALAGVEIFVVRIAQYLSDCMQGSTADCCKCKCVVCALRWQREHALDWKGHSHICFAFNHNQLDSSWQRPCRRACQSHSQIRERTYRKTLIRSVDLTQRLGTRHSVCPAQPCVAPAGHVAWRCWRRAAPLRHAYRMHLSRCLPRTLKV